MPKLIGMDIPAAITERATIAGLRATAHTRFQGRSETVSFANDHRAAALTNRELADVAGYHPANHYGYDVRRFPDSVTVFLHIN